MLGIGLLGAVSQAGAASVLHVAADVTIKSTEPDVNFNGEDRLRAQHNDQGSVYSVVYLVLDASGLNGEITDITSFEAYSFFPQYPRGGGISLITNQAFGAWSPDTLTWNNAPATDVADLKNIWGVKVASFESPLAEGTVPAVFVGDAEKNLLIDSLNSGDRKVTLAIIREGSNINNRFAEYASLESTQAGAHPIRMTVETHLEKNFG